MLVASTATPAAKLLANAAIAASRERPVAVRGAACVTVRTFECEPGSFGVKGGFQRRIR